MEKEIEKPETPETTSDTGTVRKKREKQRENVIRLTVTAMLAALIVVMSFTPLGYLRVGALSISFIMVPVAVGALTAGPLAGAILGLVFGVGSVPCPHQCKAIYHVAVGAEQRIKVVVDGHNIPALHAFFQRFFAPHQ